MNYNIENQIAARFKLVARKSKDNSISTETDWFHNIVLNTGLARMSVGTWIDRCCVGTGNTTPATSQTKLTAFLASTTTQLETNPTENFTTPPYYVGVSVTWRFDQGVAAGNISEVGLGWSNTNLWNRALILDASGKPTTITILSDEYLDVISEIRVYPAVSASGSFALLDKTGATISTHTYTGKMARSQTAANFDEVKFDTIYITDGILGDITGEPTSIKLFGIFQFQGINTTHPTTTSSQLILSLDLSSAVGVNQAFFMGISGMCGIEGGANICYQFQINPTITKTAKQKMTYTFGVSWTRYTVS